MPDALPTTTGTDSGRSAEYRAAWRLCRDEYAELESKLAAQEAREDHLLHGICDALNMLRRTEGAGPAILRALLKGTDHENHEDKP